MFILKYYPHNKVFYIRLLVFFKEILEICNSLNINPILVGSLAVFAYTKETTIDVNDIDLAVPEGEYLKITEILEEKNIEYKIRNGRVLQAKRGDIKIELISIEYWLKDIPLDHETLQVGEQTVQMIRLDSLTKFYEHGMIDRLKKSADPKERSKYEVLKVKYNLLTHYESEILMQFRKTE